MSDEKRTVMLVAENTPARQALADALRESNRYRCSQHATVDAARGTLALVRADLFLVDVPHHLQPEELSNYLAATVTALRNFQYQGDDKYPYLNVPRIALVDPSTRHQLVHTNVDIRDLVWGFIQKPINLSTLADGIDTLLQPGR